MTTRDRILDLAEALLHRHGYAGFSYADISGQLGVKNAAIHYHFPTKESLVKAVVARVKDRFVHWDNHMVQNTLGSHAKIEKFFQVYDTNCYTDERMCLVSALCSDYSQLPAAVCLVLDELVAAISTWFAGVLDEGRQQKIVQFEGSPKDRASIIQTSLMGALLLNRVQGSTAYENIKNQLLKDIQYGS